MTRSEIIRSLGGNEYTGMCRCPAHEDSTPSLSVREGSDGKVLWKCFGGCSQEAVRDALIARGLWGGAQSGKFAPPAIRTRSHNNEEDRDTQRDAFHLLRAGARAKERPTRYIQHRGLKIVPPCARVVDASECAAITKKIRLPAMVCPVIGTDGRMQAAHATYLTADGSENACDRHGKLRRMYGPVKGGYVPLAPTDPESALIVGEGIETTLAAMELTGLPGIAALSAPNLEVLVPPPCSEIVIAADNDETGRAAAEKLATRLAANGIPTRIGVPEKAGYDFADCLVEGQDRDALRALLMDAPQFKPPSVSHVLSMGAFLNVVSPPVEYLLAPWLRARSLGMVQAARGVGKTLFGMGVAYSVATGRSFLEWPCKKRGRVLYVDGELPIGLVQERLRGLGNPTDDFGILSREYLADQGSSMPDLGTADGQSFFDKVFAEFRPDLIVLDSLSVLIQSGVENEAESWGGMQDWLIRQRMKGRSVLLIHHEGKNGKQRGTSKKEDALDVILRLKGEEIATQSDATLMELTFLKARSFFGADAAKRGVRVETTAEGRLMWSLEELPQSTKDRVKEMLDQGIRQSDIAKALDLSPGRISQLVKAIRGRTDPDAAEV